MSNTFVSTTLSSGSWLKKNEVLKTGEAAKPVNALQQPATPTPVSDWVKVTQLRTALS